MGKVKISLVVAAALPAVNVAGENENVTVRNQISNNGRLRGLTAGVWTPLLFQLIAFSIGRMCYSFITYATSCLENM